MSKVVTFSDFENAAVVGKVGILPTTISGQKFMPVTPLFVQSREIVIPDSKISVYVRDVLAVVDCSNFDETTEVTMGFEVSNDGLTGWIEKGPSSVRSSKSASENGGKEDWRYWHQFYYLRELRPFSGYIRPWLKTDGKANIHIPDMKFWVND